MVITVLIPLPNISSGAYRIDSVTEPLEWWLPYRFRSRTLQVVNIVSILLPSTSNRENQQLRLIIKDANWSKLNLRATVSCLNLYTFIKFIKLHTE